MTGRHEPKLSRHGGHMEIITGDPYKISITKETVDPEDASIPEDSPYYTSPAWHVEINDYLYIVRGNARKWFVQTSDSDLGELEVGSKEWMEVSWRQTHTKHGPFHSKMEACVYIGQHYAHKRQEDEVAEQLKNFIKNEPK